MRLVLVGAVESTRRALETLVRLHRSPVALFTLPQDRRGRHSDWTDLVPIATSADIPVVSTADVNSDDALEAMRYFHPHYVLVIGWSQILRSAMLSVPRRGTIGYHPACLPENRGRAVIPWTILQGAPVTASTLFWIDDGLDTGDILMQLPFDVAPDETARSLYNKHLQALQTLLANALTELQKPIPQRVQQDHSRATYCSRRVREDGLIDWTRPAREVWTLIRASGDPYPGAYSVLGRDGRVVKALSADLYGEAPYWGLPGQVQEIRDDGALVQCGDRQHILLRVLEIDTEPHPARDILRRHDRLCRS